MRGRQFEAQLSAWLLHHLPTLSAHLLHFTLTHHCRFSCSSGHTASWGKAYPELLTRCYDTAAAGAGEEPQPSDKLGPINPARNET